MHCILEFSFLKPYHSGQSFLVLLALLLKFTYNNFVCTSHFPRACSMSCPHLSTSQATAREEYVPITKFHDAPLSLATTWIWSRDNPFSMATRPRACIRGKEFDSWQGHLVCQLYTVASSPGAKLTHSPTLRQCGCTHSKHFYTLHYLSRPSVSHFATHMFVSVQSAEATHKWGRHGSESMVLSA